MYPFTPLVVLVYWISIDLERGKLRDTYIHFSYSFIFWWPCCASWATGGWSCQLDLNFLSTKERSDHMAASPVDGITNNVFTVHNNLMRHRFLLSLNLCGKLEALVCTIFYSTLQELLHHTSLRQENISRVQERVTLYIFLKKYIIRRHCYYIIVSQKTSYWCMRIDTLENEKCWNCWVLFCF